MKLPNAGIPRFLRITRLHIVAGGALAFTLGALLAIVGGGKLDPAQNALAYLIVLFGDLSTHYSNDYFDVEVDEYAEERKLFSGSNILVNNPKLRPKARTISILMLTLSIVLAAVAFLFGFAPVELLFIALGANFLGWSYSAPPLRLISRGLGETAVALAVGFAIPAVGYLSVRGQFDPLFMYFVIPFVIYGYVLSLSLEAPDIEIDRKGGKRNIGVRKGERALFSLIFAMTGLATLTFVFCAWQITQLPLDFRVVSFFSAIPLTVGLMGFAGTLQNKKANQYSMLNVVSLFLFNLAMITYLSAIALNLFVELPKLPTWT